jgi:integrase
MNIIVFTDHFKAGECINKFYRLWLDHKEAQYILEYLKIFFEHLRATEIEKLDDDAFSEKDLKNWLLKSIEPKKLSKSFEKNLKRKQFIQELTQKLKNPEEKDFWYFFPQSGFQLILTRRRKKFFVHILKYVLGEETKINDLGWTTYLKDLYLEIKKSLNA